MYREPPWQPDPVTVYNSPAPVRVLTEHMREQSRGRGGNWTWRTPPHPPPPEGRPRCAATSGP